MFTYPILDSKIEIVGALGYDKGADGWVTPRRLPDWTRIQFADAGIERFLKFPSGVRLRFRTSANQISLKVLVSKMVITGLAEDNGLQHLTCLLMEKKFSHLRQITEMCCA